MIKKAFVVAVAIAVVHGVVAEPVLTERAAHHWQSGRSVSLVVEQDGVRHDAPRGSTIALRPAPFTVWVVYTGSPGALLIVSPDSHVFDSADFEFGLVDALGDDAARMMGMAEESFNTARMLFLTRLEGHYLPNPTGPHEHRFNRVYIGSSDLTFSAGGRDVEWFLDQTDWSAPVDYLAHELPYDELYLTLIDVEWVEYRQYVVDYDTLRLRFSD
ncbi:MAG: hypothetical protein EA382_04260 [Spirochaetaceae bacterium]|nr:MAG: hypothetical protein EA382_04260 [Spirochaetaceae bacterium]